MNWNIWIRRLHRWTSVAFAIVVAAIFTSLGMGQEPVEWVYYLPLAPLFVLLATGAWLFVLPYVLKGRAARRVNG